MNRQPRLRFTFCRELDPVGGSVDGVGVGDVDSDGAGEADVVVGVGVTTEPVQVVPFRVNAIGTGLLPVHVPLNPKSAVPPVGMFPL
ncbi:hypothetical protein GCM10027605_44110 [Micromonospora zhanjiangensis]